MEAPPQKSNRLFSVSPKENMHLAANQPFKLDLLWLQSQAFRWTEREGWYYGVVGGHLIKVRQSGDGIEFRSGGTEELIRPQVESFFRLNQDIEPIHHALRRVDNNMAELVEHFGGMRVLRQDPWATLVAYVCSARRDVGGIGKAVDKVAGLLPSELSLDGVSLKPVPTPEQLAKVGQHELKSLRLGYKYIPALLSQIASDVAEGSLKLDSLSRHSYLQARGRLMGYYGIGPKIADCVCLFGLDKPEAFPVDRHIATSLREHYGKRYTAGAKNVNLLKWARGYFGPHAGYAGQLLFYCRKESKPNEYIRDHRENYEPN